MKQIVLNLLDSAQKKMSGYAALLNYRYHNLCIVASPESLLPVNIELEGELLHIEDVAIACLADGREDQFEIYPKEREFLFPILKGIKEVHPEFKIELKDIEGEDGEDNNQDEEKDKFILATMPPVDKARHDVLMEAVGVLSDDCDARIKATFNYYSAQIVLKLAGAKPEEIDEAKDALQQINDNHCDLCKQFRGDKENEIEDAYKRFQEELAEKQAKLQEEAAANDIQAGLQMKMTPDSE